MKHTLHMQYEWTSDDPRSFNELMALAIGDGTRHFSPAKGESLEIQLNTTPTKAPDAWGKLNFITYATITYDDVKDKETNAFSFTGGKQYRMDGSMPVPAF